MKVKKKLYKFMAILIAIKLCYFSKDGMTENQNTSSLLINIKMY